MRVEDLWICLEQASCRRDLHDSDLANECSKVGPERGER